MPFRPHSGIVIIACPDPAYHSHWSELLSGGAPADSALDELLRYVTDNQGNVAPAEILSLAEGVSELRSRSPTSRMAQLIRWAFEHPLNTDQRLPHICRVAGPAAMVGDPSRMFAFFGENRVVLKGAHTVVVEGHSECMDVRERHGHLYQGDQFHLQAGFLTGGAQAFASHLAALTGRNVTFRGLYTRFGPKGETLGTEEVIDLQAAAPAA